MRAPSLYPVRAPSKLWRSRLLGPIRLFRRSRLLLQPTRLLWPPRLLWRLRLLWRSRLLWRLQLGLLLRGLPRVLLALLLFGSLPALLSPAQSLELGGATVFVRAPWRAELLSYDTTVGSAPVEYFLTLQLDPEAGASLGQLSLEQIRGADRDFAFSPERSRAFLGRPRQEGKAVPVQVQFEPSTRRITVSFPEPIPPGETITVLLRPWTNPMVADTYLFTVVAWPAGPNPRPSPVGIATLRIYERWTR